MPSLPKLIRPAWLIKRGTAVAITRITTNGSRLALNFAIEGATVAGQPRVVEARQVRIDASSWGDATNVLRFGFDLVAGDNRAFPLLGKTVQTLSIPPATRFFSVQSDAPTPVSQVIHLTFTGMLLDTELYPTKF